MDRNVNLTIWELRRSYTKDGLIEEGLPENPVQLLAIWVEQAVKSEVTEPNAMSLSTVKKDGTPDVRMVLLKEIGGDAISFFTNYKSDKAADLENHPVAACCFWWPELERQVRVRGSVLKTTREKSAAYFASRPRQSQLGAWASEQSRELKNREELENNFNEFRQKFDGREVPVPDHWGGYDIRINEIEFWQGRPGRMHDRILYTRPSGKWKKKRLAP